jgi:lipopolysaccharide transport system ATP-binding protein
MSSEPIIEVRGMGKAYPIYDKPHHRLIQMFSRNRRWYHEFEALRNVHFRVERGETVGVVGRNGSGKSTLLQIICGTLAPSSGEVHVRGRVAALLELGAGFNMEFTGRENVFMNGALMGLNNDVIEQRLAEILAFADIGEFIDRPVKTYSSGMYVRLAFAVAIHVEPDLLVVDEALSVGDEAFQRKCFARIGKLREGGCTILFVSHGAATVIELCDRAILLDRGEMLADGAPKAVISRYQRMLYAPEDRLVVLREQMRCEMRLSLDVERGEQQKDELAPTEVSPPAAGEVFASLSPTPQIAYMEAYFDEHLRSRSELAYASQGARIEDPHIQTLAGRRVNVLNAGERYIYSYDVQFERRAIGVRFGMLIKTLTGVELAGAVSATPEQALAWVDEATQSRVRFEFDCRLAPGVYFMNAGVHGRVGEEETYLDRRIDALMFRVIQGAERLSTGFIDLVDSVQVQLSDSNGEAHAG